MKHNFLLIFCILLAFSAVSQEAPSTFTNPILPGFHPDPSICRVGDDYYLVNSSFEWFPGVPIYHSKDLVNWQHIGNVLDRPEQLMMKPDMKHNRGIWAPTIRYHEGLFYMITTCQDCGGNFYVTAEDPAGPWSDPVWLDKAPGIDPSLFWDEDGSCWYTGASRLGQPNSWPNQNSIYLQQLDLEEGKLIGKKYMLTSGHASNARWTEGPHLYKIDGRYVLMVAEGGTGEDHAITVFASDSITGPYIPHFKNPMLTHRHLGDDYPITTIGHGDIVQTQTGDWWGVMLGKRQIGGDTYLLARETFLTPVRIEQGFPVFNPGVGKVLAEDKRPELPWHPVSQPSDRTEFDSKELPLAFNFLRTPTENWWQLKKGKLQITPKTVALSDMGTPSMVVRRIEAAEFSTALQLRNTGKKDTEAGLTLYRTKDNFYTLGKTTDELILTKTEAGQTSIITRRSFSQKEVTLKAVCKNLQLQFYYKTDATEWQPIGEPQAARVLSDNVAGGFNGPYAGMYALTGNTGTTVSFDWFEFTTLTK